MYGARIELAALLVLGAIVTLSMAQQSSLTEPVEAPRSFGRQVNRTALWERGGDILWGFRNLYQFHVLYDPEDPVYPFKAWFFGWAVEDCNRHLPGFTGCDAIFAARSRRLDANWEVYAGNDEWDRTMHPRRWQPVFAPQRFYFDQWHNGDPSVVKVGQRYFLAYSSTGYNRDGKPYGHPEDTDGSFLCIMGAVSDDGIHWQRSSKPILANPDDFGAPTVPQGDSHLYGSYHRPSLLYEEGKFKLWFDYWTPKGVALGYAENRGDFLNPQDWRILRAGRQPCLEEFPNPDVVLIGDLYFAFGDPGGYGSHPWRSRKIVEAVSQNGLDWVVLGYVEPDPDVPATHVPEAFVRDEGGTTWLYVFYSCQVGGEPYDYRYHRLRFMRRKIGAEELRFYRDLFGVRHFRAVLERG